VNRLVERRAGDANTSRLSDRLQARGNVYPLAINVASLDNYVAEIDTDAKPHLPRFVRVLIAASHSALDRGGALDGIDDAGELDKCAIAHKFDDTAMKLVYRRVDQLPAATLQPRQGAYLILAHEAAVAHYIGSKYSGKPPLHI